MAPPMAPYTRRTMASYLFKASAFDCPFCKDSGIRGYRTVWHFAAAQKERLAPADRLCNAGLVLHEGAPKKKEKEE
jgi:hypothetical protein